MHIVCIKVANDYGYLSWNILYGNKTYSKKKVYELLIFLEDLRLSM